MGGTLIKLAIRNGRGTTAYETLPTAAVEEAARRVSAAGAGHVGLTGGGAAQLARLLDGRAERVQEFEAWGSGARRMLHSEGVEAQRFLLVSVGTGTCAMLVEGENVRRVGGTALGGGTILGLGAALLGTSSFEEIAGLARKGDRRKVDLLVADIYPEGDFCLPGELNSASFGKLATRTDRAAPADLAHSLIALVAENVGLQSCALAAQHEVRHLVFGGGTLRANAALVDILGAVCTAFGRKPVFLPRGEFAGAVGALEGVTPTTD